MFAPLLAQLPPPTSGEFWSFVVAGVAVLGLIVLVRLAFPKRMPPIDVDLAKLATKEELAKSAKDLAEKIEANNEAHITIREEMRAELRREMAATSQAFKDLRVETRTDLAGIQADMKASCTDMREQLSKTLAADELRSSNIHKRLDPLIEKLSTLYGMVAKGGSKI